MATQSNSEPGPARTEGPAADSPSADDLRALIPDMELLETAAVDAREAHLALADSASGRKAAAATLVDSVSAAPVRPRSSAPVINDDPYADLMPDPQTPEEPPTPPRAPPAAPTPAKPVAPPPPRPAAAAPRARAAPGLPAAPRPAPAASARPAPDPEKVAVPPVMDRDFIARNRIVELYVSGKLPVRGATVFERYCRENPQILDEIGLPERVHAGLRLLEASGKPEPWQETPKRFWERPAVPLALAALVVVLGIGILVLIGQLSDQRHQVSVLHKLVVEQPLDAAATTSTVDIQPTHAGPAAAVARVIGGATAQLVNIRIDMTHSEFRAFRVTIDRVNQGRVAVLNNLIKDSNGELGLSLNSSALGAGEYRLTIEGLDWRGDPQPDSWAAISIRH
jgi:hypothetical protein